MLVASCGWRLVGLRSEAQGRRPQTSRACLQWRAGRRWTSRGAWCPGRPCSLCPRSDRWYGGSRWGLAAASCPRRVLFVSTGRSRTVPTGSWLGLGGPRCSATTGGQVVKAAYGNVPACLTQSAAAAEHGAFLLEDGVHVVSSM